MVSLVWLALSLFHVCQFSWLPVFIEALVVGIFLAASESNSGSRSLAIWANVLMGIAMFAFYKHFFALTLSPWWLLLSPVWFLACMLIPGGLVLNNWLMRRAALIDLPRWGWIAGIVISAIMLAVVVYALVSSITSRKKR